MSKFDVFVNEMVKGYTKEKCKFALVKTDTEGVVFCYNDNGTDCSMAKCHKNDMKKFDITVGKAIAYARFKGFEIPVATELTPIKKLKVNDVVFLNSKSDKMYRILKIEQELYRDSLYTIDFYCEEYSDFKQISYNIRTNPQFEKVD